MFMHLTEGKDGRSIIQSYLRNHHYLAIVIGTYWVMQGGHSHHL